MWGYFGVQPPKLPPEPREPRSELIFSEEELERARRYFVFEYVSPVSPVKREQIIGADQILNELDIYISFLKNFAEIDKLGAELDCGVLFIGAPGSGKSFCARYLASESGARFLDVNSFSRRKDEITSEDVRRLFDLCREYVSKKNAPIVLFWDEFEVFAAPGEDKEKIAAVGQLKQELSGIKGKPRGVFLVAATNSPHGIPKDLVRRGRLGQRVIFGPLRRYAKKLMLENYINQYPHDKIDYESLSFIISGDYPADIEELIKTVWCRVCLKDRDRAKLNNEYLVKHLLNANRGVPADIELAPWELHAIGSYEIGRALVSRTLNQPTQLVSLQSSGYSGAYRIVKHDLQAEIISLNYIYDEIAVNFAGSISQQLCKVEPNNLFAEDIYMATEKAVSLAERIGNPHKNHLSLVAFAGTRENEQLPPNHGISEKRLYDTKEEIDSILENCYNRAKIILEHYGREKIEGFIKILMDRGYLLQMDIDFFIDPKFKLPPVSQFIHKRKQIIGLHNPK